MANIETVRAQIRFHLAELADRNEHHAFERLCAEVTRARICSNIIPATGPVSAGGDKGRDFETFKTYLEQSPLRASSFLGRASSGILVFTCSTQHNPAASKIQSDVAKIMASGECPERIYFFSSHNIPVAKRHAVQQDVWTRYSVRLDVLDAQALAEHLSDPDLFWVAQEYLHLPGEIYPVRSTTDEDEWYLEVRERWRQREPGGYNFAEFEELRLALRHASRSEQYRGDVATWVGKLEYFRRPGTIARLRWRATYEIIVAHVYAFFNLQGREADIRSFFGEIAMLDDLSTLEDATTLFFFCFGALRRDIVDLSKEEVRAWHEQLTQRVDHLLAYTTSVTARCTLLEQRGKLAIFCIGDLHGPLQIDVAIDYWEQLLALVPQAPLYPLQSFGDFLNRILELIGDHPRYPQLVRSFDELLSQRIGAFEAANNARDRALIWARTGRLLRAINELHIAKVKWFADEAIDASIVSLLLIAQWYKELGLVYASKQYALAAAYVASKSNDADVLARIPQALLAVSDAEYQGGNWLNFLIIARLAAHLLTWLGPADDDEKIKDIDHLVYHCTLIQLFCECTTQPNLAQHAKNLLHFLDFAEAEELLLPNARAAWPTLDKLWVSIQEQLADRPFADATQLRHVQWAALGLHWHITFPNDYETMLAAEELIALSQIILADLADSDLYLLPTTIRMTIRVADIKNPQPRSLISNDGHEWEVTLPRHPDLNEEEQPYHIILLALLVHVLREVSLAPQAHFDGVVEQLFKEGLSAKTFVGQLYRVMLQAFVRPDDCSVYQRTLPEPPASTLPFVAKEHAELAWRSKLGPTYDQRQAYEDIQQRYERSIVSVRLTIARLVTSPIFCQAVANLRKDGWKDWHILMAVMGIAMNERVNSIRHSEAGLVDIQHLANQLLKSPETPFSIPVPDAAFSESALREQIQLNMFHSIKILELENHQNTPDVQAIERFLVERYRYKADDIEHEPIFNACYEEDCV